MTKKAVCGQFTLFVDVDRERNEHFGIAHIEGPGVYNEMCGYPLSVGPIPLFRNWLKRQGVDGEIQILS